jgi:hypothetical protein
MSKIKNTDKITSDDELRQVLQSAEVPTPVGGHDTARERVMGRVRHEFPTNSALPTNSTHASLQNKRAPRFLPFLGAGVTVAGLAFALFLFWAPQDIEGDDLPTDVQMQQFYDQHETHSVAHFQALGAGE